MKTTLNINKMSYPKLLIYSDKLGKAIHGLPNVETSKIYIKFMVNDDNRWQYDELIPDYIAVNLGMKLRQHLIEIKEKIDKKLKWIDSCKNNKPERI